MSPDGDSRKVQIEIVLTIIAGIVGFIALIGLVYVLFLLQHRRKQQHLRQQQQHQQQGTTIRPPSRAKLSRHRQPQASNRRQQQQQQQQQYVLSTPSQPDDTYSIDSSGTMIELQHRFNSGSGLRSVESNSSYMVDMFSLTSDMLMQQSSPTTLSTPPRPPQQYPTSGIKSSDTSTGVNFIPNFVPLPIVSSPAIVLNHPHPHHNDTSTAGDDDDFDEVWSYVATDVDIGLVNNGDPINSNNNNDDIQSIVTYDENAAIAVVPALNGDDHNDAAAAAGTLFSKPKFVGRSSDGDRNMFEV